MVGDLQERSVEISKNITQKLIDLSYTEKIVHHRNSLSPSRGTAPWNPGWLADGVPGVFVLLAEWGYLKPDQNWAEHVHTQLLYLHRNSLILLPDISLYYGSTGVAYGILLASNNRANYQQLLNQINDYIRTQWVKSPVINTITEFSKQMDVIHGLLGVGRYTLEIPEDDEKMCNLTHQLLDTITHFIPEYIHSVSRGSSTSIHLGMAHGITGILALLVTALQKKIRVKGLHEAIEYIADFLLIQIQEDQYGLYWPVSSQATSMNKTDNKEGMREIEGWCHGTCGIAWTLFRAGMECSNEEWTKIAEQAMKSVFCLDDELLNALSPTFCHGLAGLLHMAHRFYYFTGNQAALGFADQIALKLMNLYDEELPFGYQDLEGTTHVHNIGILQGATGIALSLLDYGVGKEQPKYSGRWSELFLIS
ncbi:lanthionine synthetase C family protein [Paenibacillus polymyxa]|uniref:lanthionine synthetase C family protein n=1 Tax=Paenibacillus polymyxa TaxID=1406 RepID=UPI00211D91EB|nr:lanthionine synthetase C family protein [Paenibacillus polymyxa]